MMTSIKKVMPYPILGIGLITMWLLLTSFTPGHIVLALIVGTATTHGLKALDERSPLIGRWLAIPRLFFIVLYDIIRSNIAVAGLIIHKRQRMRRSGFIILPTRLTNPHALAILSIVLTSTPGTAWLEYSSASGEILIHVFDLVEDTYWLNLIAERYESLLLEIFK